MSHVNNHLRATVLRVDQLKNQKKSRERREREVKRKKDIRRNIIIGELVCEHFPNMMKLQPQRHSSDNAKEFAVFKHTLRLLAANTELLMQLNEDAEKMTSTE